MIAERLSLLRHVQDHGPVYAFSGHMLHRLRTLATAETTVRLEEFSPPLRLPQFVTPVIARATIREGQG